LETASGILSSLNTANFKTVARALTIVENDLAGADELLKGLTFAKKPPIIGITGPPGAGKSTLVNALISNLINDGSKVAVLAIDPTSPFNFGSLLGDRIRMNAISHPRAYMRSLATREENIAVSAHLQEAIDICKDAKYDFIILESAGVGQSDASILDYCDVSMYVMTPEYGAASQLEK